MMSRGGLTVGLGVVLAAASNLGPFGIPAARACGGLFCNASQPVNQAAERIVFVDNGDGSITAVIEIQYDGPSERFSWMLPVPGVPEVGVSSTQALDRLQGLTNPQYMLQTRFEEGCSGGGRLATSQPGGNLGNAAREDEGPGVNVLARGSVGPFDYTVIMVDPNAAMPAQVALDWLETEGFDIPLETPEVLDPYLADGLNLIAFRLSKGRNATTGSIRPIVITYESKMPFIPIRPTAVAANPDMGIMVFTLAGARAVPANYKALELNEALIDWFNPMNTYNQVVTAAADEAKGQGFVTEFAGESEILQDQLLNPGEKQRWADVSGAEYSNPADLINQAKASFGSWDGFNDALAEALPMLPSEIDVSDVFNCPQCYANDARVKFDADTFLRALYEDVYRPVAEMQELVLSRPYLTRLYTTMSADEMTTDPAFEFNGDLPDVSNAHVAERVISCNDETRIELPQGDRVYVADPGTWPNPLGGEQPAARKIMQLASRGEGLTLVDNADEISKLLVAADPNPPDDGDCHAVPGARGAGSSVWLLGVGLALGTARVRRRRAGTRRR